MTAQGTALARPQLVSPRESKHAILPEAARGGNFDPDIWHIMESSDDALISEEVLYGPKSSVFVYDFKIKGDQAVQGISVIGAAHLARQYGGLKHKLVSSVMKTGSLFVFTSYPHDGMPMQVNSAILPDLEGEEDFYSVLCDVNDVKTGNSVQMEKMEKRWEKTRGGEYYERPNFQTIAQSKVYRNGILRLVPQDVQARFKIECLKTGKSKDMTGNLLDEKRQQVLTFAAKQGLPLEREAVFGLALAQITGLGDAARDGVPAFVNAAKGLGLVAETEGGEEAPLERARPAPAKPAGRQPRLAHQREPAQQQQQQRQEQRQEEPPPNLGQQEDLPPHDDQTGEIYEPNGEREPEPQVQQPAARRGLFGKE